MSILAAKKNYILIEKQDFKIHVMEFFEYTDSQL